MNNTRSEVIGIDVEIQDLQTVLYNSLISLWVNNIEGYGRAYKNTKNDKLRYEYYLGKKEYKKDTEQVKSFLSGNPEYPKEKMHIKASNLYWGFTTSLNGLYTLLRKMHTGNTSDYVLWFVIILAIFLLVGVI